MLGRTYGSRKSIAWAADLMRRIGHGAYRASVSLAREKGPFPFFDRNKYLDGAFIRELPDDILSAIAQHGIRNSHLTAIAPTGSISLLAGNVSSGIEPIFAPSYCRSVLDENGAASEFELTDYSVGLWRRVGNADDTLPGAFVASGELPKSAHLEMQAALQAHVDNAISKTVNVPEACPFRTFRSIYEAAYKRASKAAPRIARTQSGAPFCRVAMRRLTRRIVALSNGKLIERLRGACAVARALPSG